MNKHYLMSQMKSSGTAYLCFIFLGCHYAYLGKWGLQILFWVTIGGIGFWALIDLFTIPSKINKHNLRIANEISIIEKREQEESLARNIALIKAASNSNS